MEAIGEALMWLGFGVAVLVSASMIILSLAALIVARRREVQQRASVLLFRSYLIAILGAQLGVLGLILTGRLPWLFLIGILLFGLPSLVALSTRIEFRHHAQTETLPPGPLHLTKRSAVLYSSFACPRPTMPSLRSP